MKRLTLTATIAWLLAIILLWFSGCTAKNTGTTGRRWVDGSPESGKKNRP